VVSGYTDEDPMTNDQAKPLVVIIVLLFVLWWGIPIAMELLWGPSREAAVAFAVGWIHLAVIGPYILSRIHSK